CMHSDAALFVRAFDYHLGDAGLATLLQNMVANLHIFMQQPAVLSAASVPAAVPGAIDAYSEANWIDFMSHYAVSSAAAFAATSRTITVSCEKGFKILPERPRPRA